MFLVTLILQKLNKLADHDTVLEQKLKWFRRISDNSVDKKMYIVFYYYMLINFFNPRPLEIICS